MTNSTKIRSGAVLFAKDYLRITDFYQKFIGLEVKKTGKTYAKLEHDSFQLVVHQLPEHIANTIEVSEPPLRREDTSIKLVFFVASISDAREMAKNLGGELNDASTEWDFDNHKICDGHDPEGNVFQLRAVNSE